MHRFFLSPEACRGQVVALRASDARHAVNVLRLTPGSQVQILNGEGDLLEGAISECSKRRVEVTIASRQQHASPEPKIGLALAQLKPKAQDLALQKATELGVTDIWLIESEHSVSRWHPGDREAKLEKTEGTLIESMKQCGAVWKPRLHGPMQFSEWMRGMTEDWKVCFGNLDAEIKPRYLWEAIPTMGNHSICWCVGPEGDFSRDEVRLLVDGGAIPVDLGTLVLRSETAVVCGLSLLGQWRYFRRQMEA